MISAKRERQIRCNFEIDILAILRCITKMHCFSTFNSVHLAWRGVAMIFSISDTCTSSFWHGQHCPVDSHYFGGGQTKDQVTQLPTRRCIEWLSQMHLYTLSQAERKIMSACVAGVTSATHIGGRCCIACN